MKFYANETLTAIVSWDDPEANFVINTDYPHTPPMMLALVIEYQRAVAAGEREPVRQPEPPCPVRRPQLNGERLNLPKSKPKRGKLPKAAPTVKTPPRIGRSYHSSAPAGSGALGSNWLAGAGGGNATRQTRLYRERMTDRALLKRHNERS